MGIIYQELDEMIRKNIAPGMYIHIASTLSRPNAAVNSLVRVFQGTGSEFTVSATAMAGNMHVIGISGIAKKVITAFCGDNCLKARPNILYKNLLLENKPFQLEQCTTLGLIQRLMAGAQNLPFAVTNSYADSDIAKEAGNNIIIVENPADKEKKITLLRSLYPDITLVHGICADRRGNVVMSGPLGEAAWGCLAARKGVLATVEKIVEEKEIKNNQDRVIVPADRILGICEVKYGAHPQGMRINGLIDTPDYYDDYEFFEEAGRMTKSEDGIKEYFKKYINLEHGQKDYLNLVEQERMRYISSKKRYREIVKNQKLSEKETLIVLAARTIVDRVKKNHYRTILAGIGMAHIAVWTAYRILEKEGLKVRVMSELGFYGVHPEYGDVYLFSQRHVPGCEKWSNIIEILGCEVGNRNTCLGVLGASEVDEKGNINSTLTKEGCYVIGSGGANDIASVADSMVVVLPDKNRLVKKVEFITSPGKNIKDIVTSFGSFSRKTAEDEFILTTWSPLDEDKGPEEMIKDRTSWNFSVYQGLKTEPAITQEELQIVREIDPKGVFR